MTVLFDKGLVRLTVTSTAWEDVYRDYPKFVRGGVLHVFRDEEDLKEFNERIDRGEAGYRVVGDFLGYPQQAINVFGTSKATCRVSLCDWGFVASRNDIPTLIQFIKDAYGEHLKGYTIRVKDHVPSRYDQVVAGGQDVFVPQGGNEELFFYI